MFSKIRVNQVQNYPSEFESLSIGSILPLFVTRNVEKKVEIQRFRERKKVIEKENERENQFDNLITNIELLFIQKMASRL